MKIKLDNTELILKRSVAASPVRLVFKNRDWEAYIRLYRLRTMTGPLKQNGMWSGWSCPTAEKHPVICMKLDFKNSYPKYKFETLTSFDFETKK